MRLATFIGLTLLLFGAILSEGIGHRIRPDDGFGPPSLCAGNGCDGGMRLVVDNTEYWGEEAVAP